MILLEVLTGGGSPQKLRDFPDRGHAGWNGIILDKAHRSGKRR